jgi:hypothetical protein
MRGAMPHSPVDATPPPFLKRRRIPSDINWYHIDSKEGTALLFKYNLLKIGTKRG